MQVVETVPMTSFLIGTNCRISGYVMVMRCGAGILKIKNFPPRKTHGGSSTRDEEISKRLRFHLSLT